MAGTVHGGGDTGLKPVRFGHNPFPFQDNAPYLNDVPDHVGESFNGLSHGCQRFSHGVHDCEEVIFFGSAFGGNVGPPFKPPPGEGCSQTGTRRQLVLDHGRVLRRRVIIGRVLEERLIFTLLQSRHLGVDT